MTNKIMFVAAIWVISLCGQTPTRIGPASAYPPASSPGYADPNGSQDKIQSTVCKAGYTKSIRPPASYTNKLKLQQLKALGMTQKPSEVEEDHIISLELFGHPTDPRNLTPQPYAGTYGARVKDQVEDFLKRALCGNRMTLVEVQSCITVDWIACGRSHGLFK